MNILTISLSSAQGLVGVAKDGVVSEIILDGVQQHSSSFFSSLKELMQTTQLTMSDVDAIAVDMGPGSFIGVRNGIAIAQAMAFSQNIPIANLSSLSIIAEGVETEHEYIFVVQDARMQECYYGLWQVNAEQKTVVLPIQLGPFEQAQSAAEKICAGKSYETQGSYWHPDKSLISAKSMVDLALRQRFEWIEAEALEPLYIRNNVAQKPSAPKQT